MRTRDVLRVMFSLKTVSAVFVSLAMLTGSLFAQTDTISNRIVGKFSSKSGPDRLNGTIVNVSDTMVAMSEVVKVLARKDTSSRTSGTPSIMFVIDNSGSMVRNGRATPGNDANGNRFTVTSAFIDSIRLKFPNAEIGAAVFSSYLSFDPADKPYFVPCPGQANGGYLKMLKLDSLYTAAGYGNKTGYQILKETLETITIAAGGITDFPYTTLRYTPTNPILRSNPANNWYTNINAGFDAVHHAMTSALNTKENQYVIFLSDGKSDPQNDAFSVPPSVTTTPTSFTIFFTGSNAVPASINTFTANVKINGYSATNPLSNAWPFFNNTPQNLMTFMMQNIFQVITSSAIYLPISFTVNGVTATNYNSSDSSFTFPFLFPLTGTVTPINMSLVYYRTLNGTQLPDTTVNYSYSVRRQAGGGAWAPPKDSFNVSTWTRNMTFRNSNAPILEINETMDQVQLYFSYDALTTGYPYNNAFQIKIYNKIAPFDSETVVMTKGAGNFYTGSFGRRLSGAAIIGDGLLQYRGVGDSVIAIFRNRETPALPMDTLRRAIGFVGLNMALTVNDAVLRAGDTTEPLRAIVKDSRNVAITDAAFLNRITWRQLVPLPGDQLIGTTGPSTRFTATRAWRDTAHLVAALPLYNGVILYDTANIYVIPAAASHLVIEGSNDPRNVSPNNDNRLVTVNIGLGQTTANGFAVLRDPFGNYVSFANPAAWSSNDTRVVTVPPTGGGNAAIGEGIFTKAINKGFTNVTATYGTFSDEVLVNVITKTYDSLRIMTYQTGGTLTRIWQLSLPIGDSTTLYVQGFADGVWETEFIPGDWAKTDGLHPSRPPQNAQVSWSFAAMDTGHGTISVSFANGTVSRVQTSIPVVFSPGAPSSIAIYPAIGTPAGGFPEAPQIADSMVAGVRYTKLYAKVFNGAIWLPQYESLPLSGQIVWSVTPADENTLTITNSNHTELTSTRAYRTVRVTATLGQLSYSILLKVKPGPIDHLVIEASQNISDSTNDDPVSQIIIPTGTTRSPAYAILRDAFGNFVGYSSAATWSSDAATVFSATRGNTAIGEGFAVRIADFGTGNLIATDAAGRPGVTMRDSVQVNLSNIYFRSLRLYTTNPLDNDLDTLWIPTDGSQTVFVEGERSDGTGWDPVPAAWQTIGTLRTQSSPPGASDQWTVTPDSIGRGWIKVTHLDADPDSVFVIFQPGAPNSMTLYGALGNPATLTPFPATQTVAAGSTTTIVAKIFDRNRVWISAYENSAVSNPVIAWTIEKISGPGTRVDTLGTRSGHITTFRSTTAYTTYKVTATFTSGPVTFAASAQIEVVPGPEDHLVIEATPDITGELLQHDNPLAAVEFGLRDTVKTAFAIIRDEYGNFINRSNGTRWLSVNPLVVTAAEGAIGIGEGRITRVGALGETKVVATNRANPLLFDTVRVILGNFSYDALRIVVRDSVRIENLTMRSDQDTILQVQGLSSFNQVWVPVNGNWNYIATRGGTSASGRASWHFIPSDTGTGRIIVSLGPTTTPDTITVRILPGLPAKIVLYPKNEWPGQGNNPLPDPSSLDSVAAGTPYLMVAKVFDRNGVYLPDYELTIDKRKITWSATSMTFLDNLNSRLDSLIEPVQHFTGHRAYDTARIIVRLQYDVSRNFYDTLRLRVLPGPGAKIVLEKSTNYRLNTADPQDTLTIQGNQQTGSVYAVLRDAFDNYISFATIQSVGSGNAATVGVQQGNIQYGEVVARRNDSTGLTRIWAVDDRSRRDSCWVRLVPYNIIALRIIAGRDTIPLNHRVLVMNTSQDTTLHVQGQREDNNAWVDVSARWTSSQNLPAVPTAPGNAHQWSFSPSDTATGWIKVTMAGDVRPDSLPVRFTAGPPASVTIRVITPAQNIIAGRPIQAEVRLFDEDGNSWPYTFDPAAGEPAIYHDLLGNGGLDYSPFLLLGTDTLWLDKNPNDSGKQIFGATGTDTVTFLLFNAPQDTVVNKHQLYVTLVSGSVSLRDTTAPFVLHPDTTARIFIEYIDGRRLPDSLPLNGSIWLVARGYDRFGNPTGDMVSNWSVTDSLHAIDQPNNQSTISYDASVATRNEAGWLIVDRNGLRDSVYITIHGPLIRLVRAVTRDTSGNGILDRMELYFNREFVLPDNPVLSGLTIIANVNDALQVNRIIGPGRRDSVWVVELTETHITRPQTGWTPRVHLPLQSDYELADITVTSVDGAGPVVWYVEKRLGNGNIRTNDIVRVVLSEKVQKQNQSGLTLFEPPDQIFYAWTKTTNGAFVLIDSMFTDINRLVRAPGRDSVIEFYMLNGKDLNANNWVNLDTVRKFVADVTGNLPNNNNHRVKVIVVGNPDTPLIPVPNPMAPTLAHDADGFKIVNNPTAYQWVKNEGSGTVLQFDVAVPDESIEPLVKVDVKIRIYDVIGNTVQSASNSNFVSTLNTNGTAGNGIYSAAVYWNGSNGEGMICAPGVYRVVVYLQYSGFRNADIKKNYPDRRKIAMVGIGR